MSARRINSRRIAVAGLMFAVAVSCRARPAEPVVVEDAAVEVAPVARDYPLDTTRLVVPQALHAFKSVPETLKGALVNIRAKRSKVRGGPTVIYPDVPPDSSLGSGFIIDRGGYIITNHHILAETDEFEIITTSGDAYPAQVLGSDAHLNVALIKADGMPASVTVAEVSDSESIPVGEWVMALGSPSAGEFTASAGIISKLSRPRESIGPLQQKFRGFLQTDAAIHAGNTGGPLVDLAGNVIGVNIATSTHGSRINFAVPINLVTEIRDQLERGVVARAWLGTRYTPVSTTDAERLGLDGEPRGALVTEVVHGGPGYRAGLRIDDIILRFGDRDVMPDRERPGVNRLASLVKQLGPDKRIRCEVWRDRKPITLSVMTGTMVQ